MTAGVAGTDDYGGRAVAFSKADPVEDTELFSKIFDEVYEK